MTRHGRAAAAAAAGECMSADYDDGWGASDYDDGWGARRLDGSVPRRVNHDDGWGVPPHQRAEQMRRVWPQHTGVKMRRVWGRLVTTAQQDDGWGATTAQQAEWAFQAESRRMMLEGRGIWKPKHCRSLLELCAGQVFRSVPRY